MSGATYSIELWDHEIEPEGGWSEALATAWLMSPELAGERIGLPATGLTARQCVQALRYLRQWWSDLVIYVRREDEA